MEYDAFISYHHSDETIALDVYNDLKDIVIDGKKIEIFYAPIDLEPGYNFINLLNEALEKTRFFLLLLSENSLNAEWPVAEQSAAIYADPSGKMGRVIPIVAKPCRIPPLLQYRSYINYSKLDKRLIEKRKLISILKNEPLKLNDIYYGKNESKIIIGEVSKETHRPDVINEILYSNLLYIDDLKHDIWSAPSSHRSRYEIRRKFSYGYVIPPYILKNGRLYCFVNLSNINNVFKNVISNYDLNCEPALDWLESQDRNRWLIELLNDSIRKHSEDYKMSLDKTSRKFFYKEGVLKNKNIVFKPHLKRASRSLIIEHKRDGNTIRCRHRSVKLNFIQVGLNLFLKIEPSVIFTYDGRNVIQDRKRQNILCTRFLSRQKNEAVFTEFRFWVWFLSENGSEIRIDLGTDPLKLSTTPLQGQIDSGIIGDFHVIPHDLDEPPKLFESDEEGIDIDILDQEGFFQEDIG